MVNDISERIYYLDALRVVAILSVVLLHVTGHLGEVMNYNDITIYSFSGAYETFANNFFRIGIALFLMLSGALLLGRDWDVKDFFSRRIPRITKPFLFWSFIFSITLIISSYFISNINFVNNFGILDMVKVFTDTLICKAPGSAVYWFFWVILGVYLVLLLFNKWINNNDLSKIEYFLIIWSVYIVATYSLMVPVPKFLSFYISPIGFVILGYYLRHSERKIFNNSILALFYIIFPAIFMMIYSYSVADKSILFVFDRYSILVMIEAIGVFCLFKKNTFLNNPGNTLKKAVSSVAMCSYGMYLIHSQIIMFTRKILHVSLSFVGEYLILFIAGFIISWLIIYILSKISFIEDYVGVK